MVKSSASKIGNVDVSDYEKILAMISDKAKPIALVNRVGEGVLNADFTANAIQKEAMVRISDALDTHLPQIKLDGDNKNVGENLIRAIFGDTTKHNDAPLTALGREISNEIDRLNELGERVGIRATELQPDMNVHLMMKDGVEQTTEFLKANGARNADEFMRKFAEDGNSITPANVLHITDPESWIKINNRYGSGDVISSTLGFIGVKARNIGIVQTLGKDPVKNITKAARELGLTERQIARVDQMAKALTLGTHTPVTTNWVTVALQAGADMTRAAVLGKAGILALGDFISNAHMRKLNGFNGRHLSDYANIRLSPKHNKAVRKYAMARAYAAERQVFDLLANTGQFQNRMTEGANTIRGNKTLNFTGKWSNRALNWFGVGMLTRSAKESAVLQLSKGVGSLLQDGKTWEALNPRLRVQLGKWGISKKDWGKLSSKNLDEQGMVDWMGIEDDALRTKVAGYFFGQADTSVISPNVFDDLILMLFNITPGTTAHKVAKTVGMFTSFPISYTRKILGNSYYSLRASGASKIDQLDYWAKLMASTMTVGYGISQLYAFAGNADDYILEPLGIKQKHKKPYSVPGRSTPDTLRGHKTGECFTADLAAMQEKWL